VLTPGNTADCVVAETCVSLIPGITELVADKGYDTDAFRSFLKERGIKTVIPGKSNRRKRIRYDKEAYKGRNVIERCFCRLKDWRRIATRYDKLARNFLSALCFVAMLAYWALSQLSPNPSTTLADLLTPPLVANRFSTMGASLRRWSIEECEDGVADGGQCWLRRRPIDSFFPAVLLRAGDAGGRRKRSSS
jgi:transposase